MSNNISALPPSAASDRALIPSAVVGAETSADGRTKRWEISTTNGTVVSGPLGTWLQEDPSERGVAPEKLGLRLADLNQWTEFSGMARGVHSTCFGDSTEQVEVELLRVSLDCRPFDEDPAQRVPLVNVEVAPECWVTNLDPEGLAEFVAGMRAQLDVLEQTVGPALAQAREEWGRITAAVGEEEAAR
jgi:hypothetical protein